ncbi:MAG: hypothetical protein JSW38_02405 [Dehalococcoidia bacterium]|nr:MAG: hypothetical protein JSW38_02405 [Dehalococcoidia bacterium]
MKQRKKMIRSEGYAGNILWVNLSDGNISKVPTEVYADLFLGGRGIAVRIYWDEVSPGINAFDPENRLIFVTGPVSGVPSFGGSRWQVCGKSPLQDRFSYCNLGGYWGTELKFAGYDGLVVYGRADKPSYLFIEDDRIEIRDAADLVGNGAINCRKKLKEELGKSFRIVAIGPAGENMVIFASLVADNDSTGSSGLGAVMGSKNLKAIAVRGTRRKVVVAHPEQISRLKERLRLEIGDRPMLTMTSIVNPEKTKKDVCYGCIGGCIRITYEDCSRMKGKFMCQSSVFYQVRAQRYYGALNEVPFKATKLCDDYGVDTYAMETMIMWLSRCYQAGLLTDGQAEMPLSKIGSKEFIEALIKKVSHRDGFGDILANGTHRAADNLGCKAQELITDYMTETGYSSIYGARLYITTGLFYAMEPRLPINQLHEIYIPIIASLLVGIRTHSFDPSKFIQAVAKKFWGSEIAADFSTYEGKALAAAKIQDREYAKESLILCDLLWPIFYSQLSEDHVGDPTLESQVCAAVTGNDIDEEGLYRVGERVFNLQRAILVREGHKGIEHDRLEEFNFTVPLKGDFGNPDCMVPGKNGELFSRKGMVVERDKFERMKDEYYKLRGWDVATGLQTRKKLKELDLDEVARDLEPRKLIVFS